MTVSYLLKQPCHNSGIYYHPTCYRLSAISCKLSKKTGNEHCRHSCSDLTLYQNFSAKLVMRVMVMFVEKI